MTHPFDKHYFHGGAKVGGYAGSGYRDFPVHWRTYHHVMKHTPASVLELGCGRGYLLKRFADYANIPVLGLEISEHCRLTRAVEDVVTHDVSRAPWPVPDGMYDLCLSMAFLEHVPEDALPVVFAEMARTCRRGLHGIDIHDEDGFDKTHCTIRSLAWWRERMPPGHEAVDKEELESSLGLPGYAPGLSPALQPSNIPLPPDIHVGIKLNLGSFTHMFHGWRNMDLVDLSPWARSNKYQFTQWDLTRGLPYDDGIVDLIFLSHVLEHFDYGTGAKLLAECYRVLKPGGLIRIAVPDLNALVSMYRDWSIEDLREICGVDVDQATPAQLLHELLIGSDHHSIYDEFTLLAVLTDAGFSAPGVRSFRKSSSPTMRRETIDLFPDISLYVEAAPIKGPPR